MISRNTSRNFGLPFRWVCLVFMWVPQEAFTQEDTTRYLEISGYVNSYYDGIPAARSGFKPFSGSMPRSGSIGLNIAQMGLGYHSHNVRAKMVLHAGEVVQAVWDPQFQIIQEAHGGVRIGQNTWVDVGIFLPHIGAEGLTPQNQIFLTNAIISFHEPYYQAGVRATWNPDPKWILEGWILNGFGVILDSNNIPGIGWKLAYTPNNRKSFSYAGYLGDGIPDQLGELTWLWYQNGVMKTQLGTRVKTCLSIDAAYNFKTQNVGPAHNWAFGGFWGASVALTHKVNISGRMEAFFDRKGFLSGQYKLVGNAATGGLSCYGITGGGEYLATNGVRIRVEGRYLNAFPNHRIIAEPDQPGGFQRWEAILSFEASFEYLLKGDN